MAPCRGWAAQPSGLPSLELVGAVEPHVHHHGGHVRDLLRRAGRCQGGGQDPQEGLRGADCGGARSGGKRRLQQIVGGLASDEEVVLLLVWMAWLFVGVGGCGRGNWCAFTATYFVACCYWWWCCCCSCCWRRTAMCWRGGDGIGVGVHLGCVLKLHSTFESSLQVLLPIHQ